MYALLEERFHHEFPPCRVAERTKKNLSLENSRLLEELESVYQQLEVQLTTSREEARVTYDELERKNRLLERQLVELKQAYREVKEAETKVIRSSRLAAMGELAASIVHEINNPLTVIQGRVELMLLQGDLEPHQLESLHAVLDQNRRLENLVHNVLSFSRSQSAQPQLIDINALLKEVLSLLGDLKKQAARIETALGESLPQVYTDPGPLQQVFMNLFLNAMDAKPKDGSLNVRTSLTKCSSVLQREKALGRPHVLALKRDDESEREDPMISVEISDQGIGIPEDTLQKIFEAFFTTKPKGKGTGLGLSISKTILEKCGGNILAASRAGEGTTFCVFLPVWKEKEVRT